MNVALDESDRVFFPWLPVGGEGSPKTKNTELAPAGGEVGGSNLMKGMGSHTAL
jgi:hypothetical protein